MTPKIVETSMGSVEYTIVGAGEPVLFLHGGHSNCRETLFHKGFDQTKYMLITPSRPGYGNTPLNENTTPKKTADLIAAFLDALKIDRVILYAISAGGPAGIELAAKYPERVAKLILASAVSKQWLLPGEKLYKAGRRLFNPKVEWLTWGVVRLFSKIFPRLIAKSFYPQFTTNKPHKLSKKDVAELGRTFKHYRSKWGFIADLHHKIDQKSLPKIKVPTLIIHSKNDHSVPFEHATHAAQKIPGATLQPLDNSWGHLFWIGEDADQSIEKIITFIEKTE